MNPSNPGTPPAVGGHLALDFLNTMARTATGEAVEYLRDDRAVLTWLAHAGLLSRSPKRVPPGALVAAARDLRDASRALITQRKLGKRADPTRLNRFLAQAGSYRQLEWPTPKAPRLIARRIAVSAEALLAPVAEAVAELLQAGDFNLVRECENPECILWFYDRTKSHRRRWCSASACGNRAKVAAFRARKQAARPAHARRA